MNKGWLATWFGVLSLVLPPGLAFGKVFTINEQGAKAVGMGGAFVAQADDPTAVYYNPLGSPLVVLPGLRVDNEEFALDFAYKKEGGEVCERH